MKQVILDSVCIKDFRSFLNTTEIKFSRTGGLIFIGGRNLVEPTLGANGAGKSTVFDAICYCLYGVSIRGLRAADLKSYGAQATAVLVFLEINGETYWIERTSPPERLMINDQPAVQADVDRLVGLSCDRFLHSVIFGQAVPLFIDLPKPARGDLLDEVLNLEIWLRAAEQATNRHREAEANLNQLRLATGRLEGQLAGLPDIAGLTALASAWDDERLDRLGELIGQHEKIEEEIAGLEPGAPVDKRPVEAAKQLYDQQRAAVSEFEQHRAALVSERNRVAVDITFFQTHDTCPTCGQDITREFCDGYLDRLYAEQARYDDRFASITANIQDLAPVVADLADRWQRAIQDVAAAERHQAVIGERLRALRRAADDLQRQAVRTRNEKNPHTAQKEQAIAERQRVTAELDRQRQAEAKAAAALAVLHYWRQGFRRVREYCLSNVLQELTLETRNSLLALGLHGWNIGFLTQTPTQRGTVRFGVDIRVEPPDKPAGSFDLLSGGEGQRARLAVSLGLASLVQRWAGVRWQAEVFDEPTAWLSEQGVEDLLDCLAYRAAASRKTVFICDHRALNHSGFAESYLVTKDQDGSHWQRL